MCELWLHKQRRDLLPEAGAMLEKVFDEGNDVDELSQELFPRGKEIGGFGAKAAQKTKLAIESGQEVLFQPTFRTDDITCRSDILVKNGDAWDIYEVKSSTRVKEEFLIDVAFQKICIEDAGFTVGDLYIVYVDNDYVKEGEVDPEGFFATRKVTKKASAHIPEIRKRIPKALEVLDWPDSIGSKHLESCRDPYDCEYLPCYIEEFEDEKVYAIAEGLSDEQIRAFLERGLLVPEQVPPEALGRIGEVELPGEAEVVKNIDKPGLADKLDELEYPLYFLDYETYNPAIPWYDGYHPYANMVFQYSLHIQREPDADIEHVEYLAMDDEDPAPEVVASMAKHMGNTGSVIVWYAPFEGSRNKEMATRAPEYADFLHDINDRIFDLMHVVKNGYYVDSRFGGSASLKKVLPVMAPELSYDDLEIQEGGEASASWRKLIRGDLTDTERKELQEAMLKYCERDTYAMVVLLEKFREVLQTV
jgi:hypothetical protein